jgi:hypothetical protein
MFSSHNTYLTKEAIAGRMLRTAAEFWELDNANIDNFDPLIRLLIEACAVELYRIDNEMLSLQRTMTERLAGLLIPEVHIEPSPAHGILHASAVDTHLAVTKESQFLHKKEQISSTADAAKLHTDIFFAPAGKYKAVSADVKVIATAHGIYKVDNTQHKMQIGGHTALPQQCVWIGIDAKPGQNLSDIALFFDLKTTKDKERYLRMLSYSTCQYNGKPVSLFRGIHAPGYKQKNDRFEYSFDELYIDNKLENDVNKIYAHHFLTLEGSEQLQHINSGDLTRFPAEWTDAATNPAVQQLQQNLLWLKLELPAEYTHTIIDDLHISINCFPVVNKHLNYKSHRLNSYFNIIPLISEEQFFAINSVEGIHTGRAGRADYVCYPFDKYVQGDEGTYTVRSGDLERFDSRNASEYLNYLVELLRDESRAFSAFGHDALISIIKDLNQNIETIAQKVKQNASLLQTTPTYLLINPRTQGDTIFVYYWTSNGTEANKVRRGTRLDLHDGQNFKKDGIVLMTETSGGKDRLKNTEILKAFKSVLLSRNRLVTAADIKAFCFSFLLDKARDVEVSKGVAVSALPGQGLIPVVDIRITPGAHLTVEEWDHIRTELKSLLTEMSAVDINYAIQIGQ